MPRLSVKKGRNDSFDRGLRRAFSSWNFLLYSQGSDVDCDLFKCGFVVSTGRPRLVHGTLPDIYPMVTML